MIVITIACQTIISSLFSDLKSELIQAEKRLISMIRNESMHIEQNQLYNERMERALGKEDNKNRIHTDKGRFVQKAANLRRKVEEILPSFFNRLQGRLLDAFDSIESRLELWISGNSGLIDNARSNSFTEISKKKILERNLLPEFYQQDTNCKQTRESVERETIPIQRPHSQGISSFKPRKTFSPSTKSSLLLGLGSISKKLNLQASSPGLSNPLKFPQYPQKCFKHTNNSLAFKSKMKDISNDFKRFLIQHKYKRIPNRLVMF